MIRDPIAETHDAAADAAARQRLLGEHEETFFVEAGAGTGKTTALVGRIVELVAAGKLRMERLAAITFTEAAAAELRDRVRQELERAANQRSDPQEAERCARASREVDLASVETIHAFAGTLLRSYPLEAQLPPAFATLDEIQRDLGFEERFRAWLYREVPDGNPAAREAIGRALVLGMTADRLRELAARLQDYRDLLHEESTWPRPDLPDPVECANRLGRQVVDLLPLAEQAYDPADRLVSVVREWQFVAQAMLAA